MRLLSLVPLALATVVAAQEPIPVLVQYATVNAQPVGPAGPGMPPPPRGLFEGPPKHRLPPIPVVESGLPAPNSPPSVVIDENSEAASTYTVFSNPNVKPAGTSTSVIGEPDVQMADSNNGLLTGNWHASRTTDGGANWTLVNPYTRFPASYGGFCCDQRVITKLGVTAWLLQYTRDASGNNTQRIAVATSASNLGNDVFSHRWDLTAQTFGYASGHWLDFPDAAVSDDHFYFASNVYTRLGSYAGSVFWRSTRANIAAGGGLSLAYVNSPVASTIGSSFRFTRGATDAMYVGSHVDTSTIRVFRWDANGANRVDRTISTWSNSFVSHPGPDGRNWTARVDRRITGGYINAEEMGFAFSVGPLATLTNNHVRIVRLDHNRDVTEERNLWTSAHSILYPAMDTNAWGHVAVIAAIGGGTRHPSTMTLLDDDLETFSTARIFATGSSGPYNASWGDYFSVTGHPTATLYGTFYGTGMRLSGGSANANSVPEYVHFGRAAFGASDVALITRSTPIHGVPIVLTPSDSSGESGGNTPFYRGFPAATTYTVAAPTTRLSGGRTFFFHRWATRSTPAASFIERTIGQRTFSTSIQSVDDLVEARYLQARTLTVNSSNPTSGVSITVSPLDYDGAGNGVTSFSRRYYDGETVSLTAPSSVGCNPFHRWVVNGTPRSAGQRSAGFTMDDDVTAVAEYRATTLGSISQLGAGCRGASGLVPSHTISHPNGTCGPQQGSRLTYRLSSATANVPAAMLVGLSRRYWGSFTLPLDMGLIGIDGCLLYHDLLVTEGHRTDSRGNVSRSITWPVDPATVGTRIYSSWAVIDPLVRRPTPVTMSNALSLVQGGQR